MAKVILQPFANPEAQKHYADTIQTPVPLSLIQQYLSPTDYQALRDLSVGDVIPMWGVTPGENGANISKWQKVLPGDLVLFARQRAIWASARVRYTLQSAALAERLWGLHPTGQTWEYIYFLTDVFEHYIPIEEFNRAAGYKATNNIQGFTVLTENKSAPILERFGDFSHRINIPAPEPLSKFTAAARPLVRFQNYSRADVHHIFSPETTFFSQRGTWGLHGIIPLPDRKGDYVFFVTYGTKVEDHSFEEFISESGILQWQSQPSQGFANRDIQQLIHHEESTNTIHLFLRTKKRNEDYCYIGQLKYLSHNAERERPVWFKWEILDWDDDAKAALIARGFSLLKDEDASSDGLSPPLEKSETEIVLTEVTPPVQGDTRAKSTLSFKGVKRDYAAQDKKNSALGLRGELIVLAHERRILLEAGIIQSPEEVEHTSQQEGDGTGYDILSFDLDGNRKYIEVKTTRGSVESDFFLSRKEVEFSDLHPDNFYLYRLCELKHDSAIFYVRRGSLKALDLIALEYKVANLKFDNSQNS